MWNLQHKYHTKADTQRDHGRKEAGIWLHEKPEHLALAHLTKMVRCIPQIEIVSHSSLSRCSPSPPVAGEITKVSRMVLLASIAAKAGALIAALACASLVMRSGAHFGVELDLTDKLFDRMVDVGRMRRGRKILIFISTRTRRRNATDGGRVSNGRPRWQPALQTSAYLCPIGRQRTP